MLTWYPPQFEIQTYLLQNIFTEVNICKLLKNPMEALGAVDFTNFAVSNHYFLEAVVKKPCQLVKKYFFTIKLLHAYLQYVCNISTSIDFTNFAVSNHYFLEAVVKKPCQFVKNIFSPSNFFMHIFNMFVTYLQVLISQTVQYQTIIFLEQLAMLKTLSVCQKYFFTIKLLHVYL